MSDHLVPTAKKEPLEFGTLANVWLQEMGDYSSENTDATPTELHNPPVSFLLLYMYMCSWREELYSHGGLRSGCQRDQERLAVAMCL